MNNKIFITGASGNIGSLVVKELKTLNANFLTGVSSKAEEDIVNNKLYADFNNKDSMVQAFKGIDTFVFTIPDD